MIVISLVFYSALLTLFLTLPNPAILKLLLKLVKHFYISLLKKIAAIRAHISPPSFDPSTSVTCSAVFSHFEPVSLPCLKKIIAHVKSSGSPSNALPPRFFKEVWDTIGPYVQMLINSSLTAGDVPGILKQAVVQPLIKKPGLDTSNFRPISKPLFISKILAKVLALQLQSFLDTHSILEVFSSRVLKLFTVQSLPF